MIPFINLFRGFFKLLMTLFGVLLLSGCVTPWITSRGQNSDLEDLVDDDDSPLVQLVGEYASPSGLHWAKVEEVALVTQLNGTGSNPRKSALRDRLVGEMQSHNVSRPYQVLESENTALVKVIGYLPPGIQKGERFDVEVAVPSKSETKSLRGGFLMQTRLRPMERLGGGIREGHVAALAKGALLVESIFQTKEDDVFEKRARVLGGGMAMTSRKLGLVVSSDANIYTSSLISQAVNERFNAVKRGIKQNVATPKSDRRIDLSVPMQYKHNIGRYFRVVLNIPVREASVDRVERIKILEQQLLDPTTSAKAALRLEAIGEQAEPALIKGTESTDPEVKFYAAEALAYLGKTDVAPSLEDTARDIAALRWNALTALVALDDVDSAEALDNLLHDPSAEARYGAFMAMRTRAPNDPLVRGKVLGDGFFYHAVSTTGEPMVHFSSVRRPEVVLFGLDQELSPEFVYVGDGLIVKAGEEGKFKVSHFATQEDGDRHEMCSYRLDHLIRAIGKVGGSYEDVLDIVQNAKAEQKLQARVVINALATPGRKFYRGGDETEDAEPSVPIPDLFRVKTANGGGKSDRPTDQVTGSVDSDDATARKGVLGKIKKWF